MNSQRGAEGWAESRAGHQEQEAMVAPQQGPGGEGKCRTVAFEGSIWMGEGRGLLKEGE